MKLETERLVLRDLKASDIPDLIRNINNLKVSKWLLVVPYPYRIKDAKWYLKHCAEKRRKKPQEEYSFCIELKSEGREIGGISINKVDRFQGTATMGYWLGERYWRKGYMYEAASKVIEFAFNKLKLRRIDIFAFEKNTPSNALIKKLGFRYEGFCREKCRSKADGSIHSENIYGLLRKDWKKRKR